MLETSQTIWELLPNFPRKHQIDREILMEALKTDAINAFYSAGKLKVSDRVFVIRVVKRDGNLLREMCLKHRNDREIVSFAVKQNKSALKYASIDLRNDKEILKLCNDF